MAFSKCNAWILGLFLVPALIAGAQIREETILQSYERIFIRSSLNTKVNVLQDAATDDQAAEFYGPLCDTALHFVLENAALFREDPDMINITVIAVKGVGESSYSPAAETLWQIFLRFPDKVIRDEILNTLPALNASGLSEKISTFISEQNKFYSSGIGTDSQMLSALFRVLGSIGDNSAYPVLFASSLIYPGALGQEAVAALYAVKGDLEAFLLQIILNNPPAEKREAFRIALEKEALSEPQKGALAEAVMETALQANNGRNQFKELFRLSIGVIRETRWTHAAPVVLKYYNQSFAAYRRNPAEKDVLLDVISCLAALESADAAQVLSLQLGLYNSRATFLNEDDQEIVLAIIEALGSLGYKASYDVLNHIGSLAYPETIKEAALNSLNSLKW
jgi:hypothetical protein